MPNGKRWLFWTRLKEYYIFILVLAYPKRGDKTF